MTWSISPHRRYPRHHYRAAPDDVWPWIVQIGYGRGGHYGDFPWWRDPEGHRGRAASANVILNDLKGLKVGDVLLDGPGSIERIGVWRVAAVGPGTGCHRQDLSVEPGEAIRYLVEGHGGGGKIVVTV